MNRKMIKRIITPIITKSNLILFDLHGTLFNKEQLKIDDAVISSIKNKKKNFDIGILSGSELNNIKHVLKDNINIFNYIFSENGSHLFIPYYNKSIYKNLIYKHSEYNNMVELVKEGNYYIKTNLPHYSFTYFLQNRNSMFTYKFLPIEHRYSLFYYLTTRNSLLNNNSDKISILLSGNSLSIQPKEWNKSQVINYLKFKYNYKDIYYFGDQYLPNHQDYDIINHHLVKGYKINSYHHMLNELNHL